MNNFVKKFDKLPNILYNRNVKQLIEARSLLQNTFHRQIDMFCENYRRSAVEIALRLRCWDITEYVMYCHG